MHSKIKGNSGQFAIAKELSRNGYSVFTEEGDISKIDIIAEKNSKLIRIQCKAVTEKNGKIDVKFSKSGPNYNFAYTSDMFDYFGIYDLTNDKCYFIPSTLINEKSHIALRTKPTKNNQNDLINHAKDFSFEKIFA